MKKSKKIMAMALAVAISLGTVIGANVIQSKANEKGNIEKKETFDKSDKLVYSELIEKLKTEKVDIRITSLEELYNEMDKVPDITEEEIRELLNESSDEVIEEYISSEVEKVFNTYFIAQTKQKENKISENEIVDEKDKSYIRKDDSKEEKTIVTKYGTEVITQSIDETESPTKLNWIKTPVHYGERGVKKEYGDRRYTKSIKVKLLSFNIFHTWQRLRYNVSANGLKVNEVLGDFEWIAESLVDFDVSDTNVNVEYADKEGESIEGEIIFKCKALHILPGAIRYKYVLTAKIAFWNKSLKYMDVDHDIQEWVDFKI